MSRLYCSAECRYSECNCADRGYAECYYGDFIILIVVLFCFDMLNANLGSVIMLRVVILSAVMQIVIMLGILCRVSMQSDIVMLSVVELNDIW
jgi:hypothetical protein